MTPKDYKQSNDNKLSKISSATLQLVVAEDSERGQVEVDKPTKGSFVLTKESFKIALSGTDLVCPLWGLFM